jgi:mannosyltransferase
MKRTLWILLAILALAAMLRFFQLGAQSFWNDEGTSARVAERSLPLITAASIGDIHPPLYYYALHFWRGVFGESEFALRSLSAALGVLLVWLIYLLGRRLFDEFTALAAAFIAALNPFQVYYSQEARMYMLLAVWAAASTYFLVRWVGQDDILPNIGYVLTSAAGMYTHYAFPFVLVVHNLVAFVWLAVQRAGWRKWATWFALQAAVVVLYLPWVGVELQRLPEWKSPAPAYQLGPALLDTFRWFAFGRTIPTAQVATAMGIVGPFILVALWPSRKTQDAGCKRQDATYFLPLASCLLLVWWLVPVALIFAFGLYKDEYLKFLLIGSPAFCLLFARGIARAWRAAGSVVPFKQLGKGLGSSALFWQMPVILVLIFVAVPTAQSLSNLYFNPFYARDDYRGIAQRIQQSARPDDAILLEADNQWETFTYYFHSDSNAVIPLGAVRPVTAEMAARELSDIAARYKRLWVLYWAETQPDPNRYVERWLDANTFKASEGYSGTVRVAVYAVPTVESNQPDHTLDVQFGDSIRLTGYSLVGDTMAPSDIVQLTLFWQTPTSVTAPYKVFVHLLSADDRIVTQVDREPGGGLVPTTIWQPGQTIIDRHGVAIPPDTTPGRYRIAVGLYGFDDVRLKVHNTSQDQVILSEVNVAK